MSFSMKFGFIGAGRVGCSLAKYLSLNGVLVSGFFSRTSQNADFAANFVGTSQFYDLSSLVKSSDVIFITVSDEAISKVWEELREFQKENLKDKIICHCSGALSSEIFFGASDLGVHACSLHPIIAVADKTTSFKDFYEASFTAEGDSFACSELKNIINSMSNNVFLIDGSQKKTLYHIACVFQSNFIIALISIGIDLLKKCDFNENAALLVSRTLAMRNIANIFDKGITDSLTGPLERCDFQTVKKHLEALNGDNLNIYRLLSIKLTDLASCKNPDVCYDELKNFLEVFK